mgnify:CR=1 FL=1
MGIIVLKCMVGAILIIAMLIFALMLILTDEFKYTTFVKWTKWSFIISCISAIILFVLEWLIVKFNLPNIVF